MENWQIRSLLELLERLVDAVVELVELTKQPLRSLEDVEEDNYAPQQPSEMISEPSFDPVVNPPGVNETKEEALVRMSEDMGFPYLRGPEGQLVVDSKVLAEYNRQIHSDEVPTEN